MRLQNGDVLFGWPLEQHVITAGWFYNDGTAHRAIDLRTAEDGNPVKPVFAAEDGVVDWTQDWDEKTTNGMMSYGTGVRIRHSDYMGGMLQTRYAHLNKRLVMVGEHVKEGQLIGYSGKTGNCRGAHLHFEVIWKGVRRNPLVWLDDDFTTAGPNVYTYGAGQTAVVRPAKTGIRGVDVSKYQGNIDWKQVARSGIKFAILRVGSCNNSGPYVDPYFEKNYAEARAAGIAVGAYFYTYATTEAAQNAELNVWLPALEGKNFTWPVFVDVEQVGVSTALVKRAMDILNQKGFTAGWYTYTNFLRNLDVEALEAYPLWIADYRGSVGTSAENVMWQYTSSGTVPGITGNVDCNWSYVDYAAVADGDKESEKLFDVLLNRMEESIKDEFVELAEKRLVQYSVSEVSSDAV